MGRMPRLARQSAKARFIRTPKMSGLFPRQTRIGRHPDARRRPAGPFSGRETGPSGAISNRMDAPQPQPWLALRRWTPARVAIGRAGGSLPTAEVLGFAAA